MKFQIEQLNGGYMLELRGNGDEPQRYAFQSIHGLLQRILELLSHEDEAARFTGIKEKYEARLTTIREVLRTCGKALTVNEVAVQTAERMGKVWSPHFQKGVSVALANAVERQNSRVERVASGVYRYRTESPPETAT